MRRALRLLSMIVIACLLLTVPALAEGETVGWTGAGSVYMVGLGMDLIPTGSEISPAPSVISVVDGEMNGPADGGDSCGSYYADGSSQYYYGATISGVAAGAVIQDAGVCYYGSSRGSIPLYDSRGATTGIVWGDCQDTTVSGEVGFLMKGAVSGGVYVEDGAAVNSRDAVILYEGGSGSFSFNNAKLSSEAGVLLRMEEGADEGSLALNFSNGAYRGDLYNGTEGASLTVTVGRGALLQGDISLSDGCSRAAASGSTGPTANVTVVEGGIWVVECPCRVTSLTVSENATVYAAAAETAEGSIALRPAAEPMQPGVYPAAVMNDLPMGHGPALPEEAAPAQSEPVGNESAAPDSDAIAARDRTMATAAKLFGVQHAAASGQLLAQAMRRAVAPQAGKALLQGVLTFINTRQNDDRSPSCLRGILQIKTDSFVPETIDKPLGILYNPYCCLAA